MIARSRGQRPVMKIRIAPKAMAKSVTKVPLGREQYHVNGYALGRLQEQAKWPIGALVRLPLQFCILAKRLFYGKPHVLNQAIAVLRPSVSLPGRFVTVWKNQTHTTTVTLRRMRAEG